MQPIEDYKNQRIKNLEQQIENLQCTHPKTEVRLKIAVNGSLMYKKQCLRCGELIGNWIPHTRIPPSAEIAKIDETISQRYRANVKELEDALRERLQKISRQNFFIGYREYLQSPEWKEKRKLVLDRCNGICEGCRMAPANQVHHLTYNHVGNEFLFELVGLCKKCHTEIHAETKYEHA